MTRGAWAAEIYHQTCHPSEPIGRRSSTNLGVNSDIVGTSITLPKLFDRPNRNQKNLLLTQFRKIHIYWPGREEFEVTPL